MDSSTPDSEQPQSYLFLRASSAYAFVPLILGALLAVAALVAYFYSTSSGAQGIKTDGTLLNLLVVLALGSVIFLLSGVSGLRSALILDGQTLTVRKMLRTAQVNLASLQRADCKFVSGGRSGDVVLTLTDNQDKKVSFSLTTYKPQDYQRLMPVIKQYCNKATVSGNDYALRELSKY